jgi:hypothetical protein
VHFPFGSVYLLLQINERYTISFIRYRAYYRGQGSYLLRYFDMYTAAWGGGVPYDFGCVEREKKDLGDRGAARAFRKRL